MTTAEVAKKLVELCRKGEFLPAVKALYAPNIVSLEAMDMGGTGRTTEGFDAVLKKSEWWIDNHVVHSAKVGNPFVSPEKFVVQFDIDVTFKPTGKRSQMSEVGVYTVKNGKVVHEEFLYAE